MKKVLRLCSSSGESERAAREAEVVLTYQQRFQAFVVPTAPFDAASAECQWIYRIDDVQRRRADVAWGYASNDSVKSKG